MTAYGYTLDADALLGPEHGRVGAHDVTRAPAPRDERTLHLVDDGADEVLGVVRLAGDRSHLREDDEAVPFLAGDRRQQQHVREREVGEWPPRRDEPLHVHELTIGKGRTGQGQIVERAHT